MFFPPQEVACLFTQLLLTFVVLLQLFFDKSERRGWVRSFFVMLCEVNNKFFMTSGEGKAKNDFSGQGERGGRPKSFLYDEGGIGGPDPP